MFSIRLVASRGLASAAGIFAFLVVGPWQENPLASLLLQSLSLVLLLSGCLGRIWCAAYIAGRKNADVVALGPYSVCRNPLYFFSMLGFMGAGLAFESFAVCAIFLSVFFITHWPTILGEERYLRRVFGSAYETYCARVPRFVPRLGLYEASPSLSVDTPVFMRALREAGLIPLSFIAGQAVVLGHQTGWIPSLFRLW